MQLEVQWFISGLVENGAISQKELDELMEMLRKTKS